MTSPPRALLLDLDDTILAFSAPSEPCWRQAAERHEDGFRGVSVDRVLDAIWAASSRFWSDAERSVKGRIDLVSARRECVGEAFDQLGIDAPEVVCSFVDCYSALRDEAVRPLPGATDALHAFRARGQSLAVVSNGGAEPQRAKIDRFGLGPFFDAILIEGEWGVGKPDPSIFLEALRRLDVPREHAWMVGDNLEADVAGAQAAGLYTVWNDLERRGLPESSSIRPDRIIHQLSELL